MSSINSEIKSGQERLKNIFFRTEKRAGISLLLPSLLIFAVIVIFPLLYSIYLSFNTTSGLGGRQLEYVGVSNYISVLSSEVFWTSFQNNIIWTAGTLGLQMVLGISIALVLHQSLPFRNTIRGIALFPYMIPTIVAALNFRWILHPLWGIINNGLSTLGIISKPIVFLGNDLAMGTAILLGVWRFTPFVIITVLARLQTIPPSLYEAAEVNGAYKISKFVYITLPQISNILILVILLRGVWMFKKFAPIFLLTGGGPGVSTQHLPIYAYRTAFDSLQFGRAATIANLMFAILMIVGFLYIAKFFDRGGATVEH
jgi:multiple sugar transport system permease protein